MSDETLKPCPFCGDPMKTGQSSMVEHADHNADCPIGQNSWPVETWLERWNTRLSAPPQPEGDTADLIQRIEFQREVGLFESIRVGRHVEVGEITSYLAALQAENHKFREALKQIDKEIYSYDEAGPMDYFTAKERSTCPRDKSEVVPWANEIATRAFREGMVVARDAANGIAQKAIAGDRDAE